MKLIFNHVLLVPTILFRIKIFYIDFYFFYNKIILMIFCNDNYSVIDLITQKIFLFQISTCNFDVYNHRVYHTVNCERQSNLASSFHEYVTALLGKIVTSTRDDVNLNAFVYIVVVIGSYAIGILILMVKYVRSMYGVKSMRHIFSTIM